MAVHREPQGQRIADTSVNLVAIVTICREPGVGRMIFSAKERPKARPASGQWRVGRMEKAVS